MRAATIALVLLVAGTAGTAGCKKKVSDAPVAMEWAHDLDSGLAAAKAQHKLVFLFFGASWDAASSSMQKNVLTSSEVAPRLRRDFVAVNIDMTDDENRTTRTMSERFKVLGTPTMIILRSDGVTEIKRRNEYLAVPALAAMLDEAAAAAR